MRAQSSKNKGQGKRTPTITEGERRLLNTGWPIIFVFGQSGAGKSTFVNLIAKEKQEIGTSVDSCTERVVFLEARIQGNPIVIVDTPPFDDTRPGVTEADVLETIANSLEDMGREKKWVTGVLYLHRITDTWFTPTANRIITVLRELCGDDKLNRVMLCTTMWDLPTSDQSKRRHDQVCNYPVLAGMISKGAKTSTHSNSWSNAKANAEKILSDLIDGLKPGALAIQNEIIQQDKTVAETEAGKVLTKDLGAEKAQMESEIRELRQLMSVESGANAGKLAEALATQERLKAELERQQRKIQAARSIPESSSSCIIC